MCITEGISNSDGPSGSVKCSQKKPGLQAYPAQLPGVNHPWWRKAKNRQSALINQVQRQQQNQAATIQCCLACFWLVPGVASLARESRLTPEKVILWHVF